MGGSQLKSQLASWLEPEQMARQLLDACLRTRSFPEDLLHQFDLRSRFRRCRPASLPGPAGSALGQQIWANPNGTTFPR